MNSKAVSESIGIAIGVALVAVIQLLDLSKYSSYLLALLIIFFAIYISIKKRSKSASELFSGSPVELFGIVSIITLIISLTNGLLSPLFFFLYFILFLLAFLCESITVMVFLSAILIYFLPQAFNALNTDTLVKLGSLVLIAPIAYFIGREFERRNLLNKKIESKTDEIIHDAQILKEEQKPREAEETEAIDEIIEEAESLKGDTQI